MGRTGHPALLLGTAAVVVAAVGTSVALTRDSVPVAKAATTLAAVHGASLVSPSGVAAAARNGERVPNGYVVRTTRSGTADLLTRGRIVHVGDGRAQAAVAVVNGAHQQLRTGTAIVDAQHGPGVTMDVAGDVLTVPDHAATEATRSVSVLVGSLVGSSALTNSSARALTIPALYQAEVSGDALPTRSTPLYLTDSPAEAQVVPGLVSADNALQELARGIDQSGAGTSGVIEASWSHPTINLPNGTPRSERVLPIVIAASTSMGSATNRYDQVLTWRGQGGSWGVVVDLLHGSATGVANQLAGYAKTQPLAHVTTASLQQFVAPHAPHPGHSTSPNPHPTHSSTPTSPPTHPVHTPKPTPTSSTPVQKVVGTVGTVVQKVVGLLPTIKPVVHTKTSPGLLGGLLGH